MRGRQAAFLLPVFALVALSGVARATDNVPGPYWFNLPITYQQNSSLPADWRDAIQNGSAKAWNDRTGIRFTAGSNTTSSDPNVNSTHIIWRGAIPSKWTACPPSISIACTRWKSSSYSPLSIYDGDTVINDMYSLGASSTNCALSIGIDVQSVMTHELGHWGHLNHTVDPTASMFANYHGCQRLPTTHDVQSMNVLYYNGSL